jgi:hypothetical protein
LFDSRVDLDEIEQLLSACEATSERWLDRRRRRRATERLAELAGSQNFVSVAHALVTARRARAVSGLLVSGGPRLEHHWQALEAAEADAFAACGRWLSADARSSDRLTPRNLAAVAALATALRSGRAARRAQLLDLQEGALTRALPLWLGTLEDIEDLLPAVPALFDIVILDEASSIDQMLAAPALLRARRAVIVGDPNQLRHTIPLAEEVVEAAIRHHRLDEDARTAARLDVIANSIFDVAVGAAPVTVLDEHFRSNPHLIEWVGQRLYDDQIKVATRNPRSDCTDCIDVIRVEGERGRSGAVEAEVVEVQRQLRALQSLGVRDIGIVSPSPVQAEALERMVLSQMEATTIKRLNIRVGDVEAFQGNERDVVIGSLAIAPDDPESNWSVADDRHLLSVFLTRARRRMIMIYSADPPMGTLLYDYLCQAENPPGPPESCPVDDWSERLCEALTAAGVEATCGYPVGRHVVDIVAGDEWNYHAIECAVHPAGPQAHIDRRLALRRLGWEFMDAFPSTWRDRPTELIVELARTATS